MFFKKSGKGGERNQFFYITRKKRRKGNGIKYIVKRVYKKGEE